MPLPLVPLLAGISAGSKLLGGFLGNRNAVEVQERNYLTRESPYLGYAPGLGSQMKHERIETEFQERNPFGKAMDAISTFSGLGSSMVNLVNPGATLGQAPSLVNPIVKSAVSQENQSYDDYYSKQGLLRTTELGTPPFKTF